MNKTICPDCLTPYRFRDLLNHRREGRKQAKARGY